MNGMNDHDFMMVNVELDLSFNQTSNNSISNFNQIVKIIINWLNCQHLV